MTKAAASRNEKADRTSKSGRFMGIRIVDPAVKPKTTTVKQIRAAVRELAATGASSEKRSKK